MARRAILYSRVMLALAALTSVGSADILVKEQKAEVSVQSVQCVVRDESNQCGVQQQFCEVGGGADSHGEPARRRRGPSRGVGVARILTGDRRRVGVDDEGRPRLDTCRTRLHSQVKVKVKVARVVR